MKIAIMQPYFAPYLGYISLIKHTDRFILFDPVQFIRHGWIERNRVLKQGGGWMYVQVPLVKMPRETLIQNLAINNSSDWKGKILAQLQPYKKIAPYYKEVVAILTAAFANDYTSITHLNKALLQEICSYLSIERTLEVYSDMSLEIEQPSAPDEWALNICKALGGKITYINPIGGLDFFDRSKYEENGINIFFQKMQLLPYNQRREPFEAGLSIIDVLMFNSAEEVHHLLDQYELL